MRGASQRDHGEAMLVSGKFRDGFVRRPAAGDEKNAIQMKTVLGGARHCNVAGVDGVKGSAKQRDLPSSGRFLAAFGGPLRFQISSAPDSAVREALLPSA